ncbi:MAG: GNAT family N-acetyltransferase [Acidimicrobiales bacterium]
MRVTFRPSRRSDLPMLHRWLNDPAVVEWWEGDDVSWDAVTRDYGPDRDDGTEQYIAVVDGRDVGWIQCYAVESSDDEREAWRAWGIGAGSAAIDYLLGESVERGRGVGAAMIRAFVDQVVFGLHPHWSTAAACPYAANVPSCRALEKAGFRFVGIVDDDDGPCRLMARERPGPGAQHEPSTIERALITFYDQEASERASRPLESGRVAARDRFLALLGPTDRRVLELGPGAGRDSAALIAAGWSVVGVDLLFEQLRHARSVGLAGATVGTVRQLPFPDSSFGALWTMSTLMHVPNETIDDALRELRRIMVPGSLASIGVWGGPDVEDHGDTGGSRLFSRRSDTRWRQLIAKIGEVELFENWHPDRDDFWYQWAVVRR